LTVGLALALWSAWRGVDALRTALNDAYLAVGRTPPTYTDPTAAAGLIIKAAHLNELRAGVRVLQ